MAEPVSYKTLKGPSEGLYKEKGSRFIAHAFPVKDEEMVRKALEDIRKRYHDARHHCYAYRLGPDGSVFRFNDDGEPSGTAGKPIYGQLLSFDVTHALIVVVRYFGGIKLGTGGLIQAYKAAAKDALEQAMIETRLVTTELSVEFGYDKMHDINKILKEEKITPTLYNLSDRCQILLTLDKTEAKRLVEKLGDSPGVTVKEIPA